MMARMKDGKRHVVPGKGWKAGKQDEGGDGSKQELQQEMMKNKVNGYRL